MSYNPAIPLATDLISDSQADIYNNFQAISTWVQVDHVNFGNPTQGEHLQVTFASKNTPSAPTDPISVLYTGNSAGVAWPFFRNATAIYNILPDPTHTSSDTTENYSFAIGKIKVSYGTITLSSTSGAATFATDFTNLYAVVASVNTTSGSRYVTQAVGTPSTVTVYVNASLAGNVSYFAIGD